MTSDGSSAPGPMGDLGSLFPIGDSPAAAYRSERDDLIARVNDAVLSHPALGELIGGCPVDLVRDNHHNHFRFMLSVFELDLPELLQQVVPWVYRAYISRGFSPDYFPVELSAWQQAVEEELAASEAAPIRDVYQWMLERHDKMLEASRGEEARLANPEHWDETNDQLLRMLLQGESRNAQGLVSQRLHRAGDLSEVYLRLVQPVMYRIGTMWEDGEVSVAQEHLATAVASRLMTLAYQEVSVFNGTRGRAIVTAAPGELHELGARIVADLLEAAGWDITFLGANVPVDQVVALAADLEPAFVAASATMPYHLLGVRDLVRNLHAVPELSEVPVMAGGLAFNLSERAAAAVGADGTTSNGREAVLLAEKLTGR